MIVLPLLCITVVFCKGVQKFLQSAPERLEDVLKHSNQGDWEDAISKLSDFDQGLNIIESKDLTNDDATSRAIQNLKAMRNELIYSLSSHYAKVIEDEMENLAKEANNGVDVARRQQELTQMNQSLAIHSSDGSLKRLFEWAKVYIRDGVQEYAPYVGTLEAIANHIQGPERPNAIVALFRLIYEKYSKPLIYSKLSNKLMGVALLFSPNVHPPTTPQRTLVAYAKVLKDLVLEMERSGQSEAVSDMRNMAIHEIKEISGQLQFDEDDKRNLEEIWSSVRQTRLSTDTDESKFQQLGTEPGSPIHQSRVPPAPSIHQPGTPPPPPLRGAPSKPLTSCVANVTVKPNPVKSSSIPHSFWLVQAGSLLPENIPEVYKELFCRMTGKEVTTIKRQKVDGHIVFLDNNSRTYGTIIMAVVRTLKGLGVPLRGTPQEQADEATKRLANLDPLFLDPKFDFEILVPSDSEMEKAIIEVNKRMNLNLSKIKNGKMAEHDLAAYLGDSMKQYGSGERFLFLLSPHIHRVRAFVALVKNHRTITESIATYEDHLNALKTALSLMMNNENLAYVLVATGQFQQVVNQLTKGSSVSVTISLHSLPKYCKAKDPSKRISQMRLIVGQIIEKVRQLVTEVKRSVNFREATSFNVSDLVAMMDEMTILQTKNYDSLEILSEALDSSNSQQQSILKVLSEQISQFNQSLTEYQAILRVLQELEDGMIKFYGDQPVFRINEVSDPKYKGELIQGGLPFLEVLEEKQEGDEFDHYKRGTVNFFKVLREIIECLDGIVETYRVI